MSKVFEQKLLSLTMDPGRSIRLSTPLQHLGDVGVVEPLHDGVLAVLGEDVQVQESADLIKLHRIFHPIPNISTSLVDQIKVYGVNIEGTNKNSGILLMDDRLVKDNPHGRRKSWSNPVLSLLSSRLKSPGHEVPEERRPRTENRFVAGQLDRASLTTSLFLTTSEDKDAVSVLAGQVQVLQVGLQEVWYSTLPS